MSGQRVRIATTAGQDGILGASVSPSAGQTDSTKAYGVFAGEARALDANHAPRTVNPDGWQPTPGSWRTWFPNVTLILCFLHAFLKIRGRTTTAFAEIGRAVPARVREAYHAPSKRAFSQRLRRLEERAETALPDSAMKSHTLEGCDKRAPSSRSYDHLRAHRSGNRVDGLMKCLDWACFNGRYFHGTVKSAESRVRALGLLWNCCPSSPATVKQDHGQRCPAERINGWRYAESGLENWLISGSMNGVEMEQQNPL